MASNRVQLTGRLGPDVSPEIEEVVAEAVTRAVVHPSANIDAILQRARSIAQEAVKGRIQNVLHYATKALFLVSKNERLKVAAEPIVFWRPDVIYILPGFQDTEASIEARLLMEECLASLSPLSRGVVVKNAEGFTHREIAHQLGISEVNSRFLLSRARRSLAIRLSVKR
jgi:DNA-directed RNA polymerase specialized sigma24 family protein